MTSTRIGLEVDLFQPQQGQNVDLQGLQQLVDGSGLIGTVHRAAELGDGQLRVLRAKADGIGEVAGIGAAAHGKRGGVVARHLIVGVDAGLDGGGVRLDVERLVHADVGQLGTAANEQP